MEFLPDFPLHLNALSLFGILLLAGLVGGELARRTKFLPQIVGYTIIGYLISRSGLDIIDQTALKESRVFVQISLGLILFDLGRYLDFKWLRHDPGLLFSSLLESALTFVFIFSVLLFFNFSILLALLGAIFAIATSPAVIMLIANDLSAQGPVTRRTLILTSLNNFYSLVLFSLLLPVTVTFAPDEEKYMLGYSLYRLLGSLLLGMGGFLLIKYIAYLTNKFQIKQFVLIIGTVIITMGTAQLLNLSTMLSLFVLGVMVRNFDTKHVIMEVDITWLARPFLILLFVISGFYLHFQSLLSIGIVVIAFIVARMGAKFLGVWLFTQKSRLSYQQSLAIGLALTPMGAVAIGMYSALEIHSPEFSHQLTIIITAVLTVLNLLGPIATQFALIKSNENEN